MGSNNDEITIPFGEEDRPKASKNPVALFFHVIFRATAILAYIFFNLFMDGFVVTFVVIVVLLSLDFWTTKNITGRLLVGLRWWNHVDDQGKSHWVFESRKTRSSNDNAWNSVGFWMSIVVAEIIWILFVFAALVTLKFHWLTVAIMGVCLTGANLYGYIRCKFGSHLQMRSNASNFLGRQMFSSVISKFTSPKNPSGDTVS